MCTPLCTWYCNTQTSPTCIDQLLRGVGQQMVLVLFPGVKHPTTGPALHPRPVRRLHVLAELLVTDDVGPTLEAVVGRAVVLELDVLTNLVIL